MNDPRKTLEDGMQVLSGLAARLLWEDVRDLAHEEGYSETEAIRIMLRRLGTTRHDGTVVDLGTIERYSACLVVQYQRSTAHGKQQRNGTVAVKLPTA